jgi:hypothetical protein
MKLALREGSEQPNRATATPARLSVTVEHCARFARQFFRGDGFLEKLDTGSAWATAPTKPANAMRKRFCASVGGSSGAAGCGPITSSSAGITSTTIWPLLPGALRSRCRQASICS